MLSLKTQYALVALFEMINKSDSVQTKVISQKYGISQDYLEQILFSLGRAGFCKGKRGRNGGYRLSKSPKLIIIGDIIDYLEGDAQMLDFKNTAVNKLNYRIRNAIEPVINESLYTAWMQYQPVVNYAI